MKKGDKVYYTVEDSYGDYEKYETILEEENGKLFIKHDYDKYVQKYNIEEFLSSNNTAFVFLDENDLENWIDDHD